MLRTPAVLTLALAICAPAAAQIIVRPPRPAPQPAGVIKPPLLPIAPGSLTPPGTAGLQAQPVRLRPGLIHNPYYDLWGFAPLWPVWYDTPPVVVNHVIPLPVPTPVFQPPAPPPAPPEPRARLTLSVPPDARVWLAGKEIDAAASPVVLDSPALQEGQSYAFDVRVSWVEGRLTEERARVVSVEAGQSKSLTYLAAR